MRFEQRLRDGITEGTITIAFRRWRKRQVSAGRRYRTGTGFAIVDAVEEVDPAEITEKDARRAGYKSPDEVRHDLRGDPGAPVYRIELRAAAGPDERAELAQNHELTHGDIQAIKQRLARLDKVSPRGPWTAATLYAIWERPDVLAADLAAAANMPRDVFKRNVSTLKAMGLTISQRKGYRLSPRGRAYLHAQGRR